VGKIVVAKDSVRDSSCVINSTAVRRAVITADNSASSNVNNLLR
jgi:hypothetical protein